MKIRIKFCKYGCMKFIGHLDVMRYFQKAMRRADVDIAYSEGFSPHQIMSFAAPLGVGLTSKGEYFDIEVHSTDSSEKMVRRINDTMVEGIEVLSYRLLPDDSKNAMSLVAGADYKVRFREKYKPNIFLNKTNQNILKQEFCNFINRTSIEVIKQTKKSETLTDIKPMIYEAYVCGDDSIFLKLATGSANNLKPDLVMKAFSDSIGFNMNKFAFETERLELYGMNDDNLVPLEEFGEEIE